MWNFHDYAMQEALREARLAFEEKEVPIGAVITQGERILARAHNQTRTFSDPTAHAEILVITAACNLLHTHILPNCTLYVTIEPCPMCAGALLWAQMGTIYYGATDAKRGYTLYAPNILHPRTTVHNGLCEGEAVALMRDFFQSKRS